MTLPYSLLAENTSSNRGVPEHFRETTHIHNDHALFHASQIGDIQRVIMVQKTQPFSQALADHQISAGLVDVDLYRIHGGMAVETDYIIRVEWKNSKKEEHDQSFEPFTISKTFHHFRTFAKQLKAISDGAMASRQGKSFVADQDTKKLGRYCAAVHHLIQGQSHQYIGKVSKQQTPRRLFLNAESARSFRLITHFCYRCSGQLQIRQGSSKKTQLYC